jgi:lysophospholipase L1-like esterase
MRGKKMKYRKSFAALLIVIPLFAAMGSHATAGPKQTVSPPSMSKPAEPVVMTPLPDGRLIAVFDRTGANGPEAVARYSSDGGRTWSPPDFLFTLPATAAAATTQHANVAATPARPTDPFWVARNKVINERAKRGGVDLVFIGDSITQRWEENGKEIWDKYYAGRRAMNAGIDGDATQTVLWRIKHGNLEGIHPKVVVLLIGSANTTDSRQSPENIADGILEIVKVVRHRLPETRILLLSILPRWYTPTPEVERGAATNQLVSKLADNRKVFYLDISKKLVNSEGITSLYVMPEYAHLTRNGYQAWAEAMEPTLAWLFSEK